MKNQVVERTRPGGCGGIADWRELLVKADILAIDDLDKARFTPRVEAELFDVLDQRTNARRPVVITTNSTSDSLLAKLSPDTGPAIVRRIQEFCFPINFNPLVDSKDQLRQMPKIRVSMVK